jgi:hypothetical protein
MKVDIERVIDISKHTMNFKTHKVQLNVPKINCEILYNTYRGLVQDAFKIKMGPGTDDVMKSLHDISNIMEFLICYNTIFQSDLKTVIGTMRSCASLFEHGGLPRSGNTTVNTSNIISFLLAEDNFRDSWESYIENIMVEVNNGPCIVNRIRRMHMLIENHNNYTSTPVSAVTLICHVMCNFMTFLIGDNTQANFLLNSVDRNYRDCMQKYKTHSNPEIAEAGNKLLSTDNGPSLYSELNNIRGGPVLDLLNRLAPNNLDVYYIKRTFEFITEAVNSINNDSEGNIDGHPWPDVPLTYRHLLPLSEDEMKTLVNDLELSFPETNLPDKENNNLLVGKEPLTIEEHEEQKGIGNKPVNKD